MEDHLNERDRDFNLADFYEELGKKYPEEELTYLSLEAKIRKKFITDKINNLKGILLDAGCNRGMYCNEYKNGPVIGVDISPTLIDLAKGRVPDGTFYVADIRDLSFIASQTIDNVLCTEVLEHIPDPTRCIEEFFRVLKPGGNLLITVPNLTQEVRPTWKKKPEMDSYGIKPVEYYHTAYNEDELRSMVSNYGFYIVDSGTIGHEVIFAESKLPKWVRIVKRILTKFGFGSLGRRLIFSSQRLILFVYKKIRNTDNFVEVVGQGSTVFVQATKLAGNTF